MITSRNPKHLKLGAEIEASVRVMSLLQRIRQDCRVTHALSDPLTVLTADGSKLSQEEVLRLRHLLSLLIEVSEAADQCMGDQRRVYEILDQELSQLERESRAEQAKNRLSRPILEQSV